MNRNFHYDVGVLSMLYLESYVSLLVTILVHYSYKKILQYFQTRVKDIYINQLRLKFFYKLKETNFFGSVNRSNGSREVRMCKRKVTALAEIYLYIRFL